MADGSGLSCTVAHAARALMASVCRVWTRIRSAGGSISVYVAASGVFPLKRRRRSSCDLCLRREVFVRSFAPFFRRRFPLLKAYNASQGKQ